jgi:hypothetical protein
VGLCVRDNERCGQSCYPDSNGPGSSCLGVCDFCKKQYGGGTGMCVVGKTSCGTNCTSDKQCPGARCDHCSNVTNTCVLAPNHCKGGCRPGHADCGEGCGCAFGGSCEPL